MKELVNIASIKENEENPRYIRDPKFKKLVKSIKEFPEMLEKRPIVVDENMVVLGGNMRLQASKAAGLFEVWIDKAIGWSEQQKREFIIKDNVGFGEWDWDILANDWDSNQLIEWGMDLPEFETDDLNEVDNKDISDDIDSLFRIEIELENENEQEKMYNKLISEGYKCRILTL